MILAILLFIESIFAEDLKSRIEGNHFDIKLFEKRDFVGKPRFNASCDSDSLDAAALCEIKDVPRPAEENFTSILISAHVENFAKVAVLALIVRTVGNVQQRILRF